MSAVTYSRDTFERADADDLGVADTGQIWAHSDLDWGTRSGRAAAHLNLISIGRLIATVDAGVSDCTVLATAALNAPRYWELVFRYADANRYWFAEILETEIRLVRVEVTPAEVVVGTWSGTAGVGAQLRVDLDGARITVRLNGAPIISVVDSYLQTETRHGLGDASGPFFTQPYNRWEEFWVLTMPDPVGYASFFGIGLENTAGTPVKSQWELDFTAESIRGQGEPIRSRSINRIRGVKKAVMGAYEAGGDVTVEWTPDKLTKLLYAAMSGLGTTGSADPWTHTFKPGSDVKPVTAQILRDDVYFIYPGLYVSSLRLRAAVDEILMGTFSLQGRGAEKLYNAEQSDVAIAASSLDPFVFHQGAISLHGATTTDTNNWDVSVNTGLLRNRGIQSATRSHNRAHAGEALCEGSFDLVFDTVEEHRRWMGASSSSYPIALANALQTLALSLVFTQAAGRVLQIDASKAYYKASGPAVEGKDRLIIQRVDFSTLWDTAESADVKFTIQNAETNANITTLGTNI